MHTRGEPADASTPRRAFSNHSAARKSLSYFLNLYIFIYIWKESVSCSQRNKSIHINTTPKQRWDLALFNATELNLLTLLSAILFRVLCIILNWREAAWIPDHVVTVIRCYIGRRLPICQFTYLSENSVTQTVFGLDCQNCKMWNKHHYISSHYDLAYIFCFVFLAVNAYKTFVNLFFHAIYQKHYLTMCSTCTIRKEKQVVKGIVPFLNSVSVSFF